MRLIPGKTKVQIELFKGISLTDILIILVSLVLIIFVLTSSLPGKFYIVCGLALIGGFLVVRLDDEPNYILLIHILRHLGYPHFYAKSRTDAQIAGKGEEGETAKEIQSETAEERKKRLKAETKERKDDDRKLKDRNVSKAEKDAIWLKRAKQSAAKKQEKNKNKKINAEDMGNIIAFTDIKDDFIEYGGDYFGAALEIPAVEFRLFTNYRRNYSIENCVGKILRSIPAEYSVNIVKIERPVMYDEYLANEYKKIDDLRDSYEKCMITEEEFKIRVEVLCDRINELRQMMTENKIIVPFYYMVLFDSDKTQLTNLCVSAIDSLRNGDIHAHRLDTKELALFLKYSYHLDFDEREIESVDPKDYAEWAMPKNVTFQHRSTIIEDIVTHNMHVVRYPSHVDDAWLASVMSIPATKVMVKCKPMEHDRSVRAIDNSITELRGQLGATGIESKRIELTEHIDTLSALLTTLQSDNESLLEVNIYVTGYDIAATKVQNGDKSGEKTSDLVSINNMRRMLYRLFQESNLRLNSMEFDQVPAFIAGQVSGYDPLEKSGRGIPTNTVAACYPWVFARIEDKNGVRLGSFEGAPVFIDFFRRDSERVNSNMVIVGKSGSGKSFATKSILTNLAADDAKIFILDPENEYTELAYNLHGKFINVGNAQYGRLNPFHIITALDDDEAGTSGDSGSYATHLQFLEEFFRQILPDCDKDAMEYLNSMVDRLYSEKGITAETDLSTLSPDDYPVFDDLYDMILSDFQSSDNDYIKNMLRTLMNYIAKFSSGGRDSNIWNGKSTVTTDENFTVFNFQSLLANRNGSIANAQMLLVLKYIDNEIIKNRDYNTKYHMKRKIVVVIDEAHVFIDTKYPIALDFMFQLAKRIRKYNGMQIVITQNIKDFVGSEEIARKSTAIINACQYSFIFSLAPNDMDDLCKLYEKAGGINENEQEQIVSAPRGQAFAVMSPQSRSTFKVEVPEGVTQIFRSRDFVTRYFNGEDGEAKWNEIVGDSREVHDRHMAEEQERTAEVSISREKKINKKHVTFIEMSEDELERQRAQDAEEEIPATEPAEKSETERPTSGAEISDTPEKTLIIEEEPEDDGFTSLFADPEPEREIKGKKTAYISAPHERTERNVPQNTENTALPQIIVQAPQNSENTEKMLADLLGKFSYDAMIDEIRRSVKEELRKELEDKNIGTQTSGNKSSGEESTGTGVSLGSIFNDDAEKTLLEETAGKDAEVSGTGSSSPAETGSEGESFDIIEMLMREAENMEDISPIDMMISYNEEIVEIKFEELIKYNSKH